MKSDFWHELWEKNDIGFHQDEVSPLVKNNFDKLPLAEKQNRIFIPLCGKTLVMPWLLSQGCQVVGVELSELAIEQLFAELGITPKVKVVGELKHYHAENLDLYVGDVFDLTAEILGEVDAIFDRGALEALSEDLRQRYSRHLSEITKKAPQLLIACEYNQALMEGPPFSISAEGLAELYKGVYEFQRIERSETPLEDFEDCDVYVNVWLLRGV